MSNKFLDKDIYNKAKKLADKKYEKHSAYKSMYLVEEYERLGGRINKNLKKSGTATWNKEKWKNLTPIAMGIESKIKNLTPCGEKHPKQKTNPTICRPTIKINKNTTSLAQSFTKSQIKKALEIKKKGLRINWKEL